MKAILTIIFVIVTQTISQVCNYNNSVELIDRKFNGVKYEDGEYFIDNITETERGCVCMKETCIRKCCPIGQGYNPKTKKCVDITKEFDPPVWEGLTMTSGFYAVEKFHLLISKMECSKAKNEYRIMLRPSTEFHLKTDGKLYVLETESQISHEYSYDKYCLDNFIIRNEETQNVSTQLNALICFIPKVEENHYGVSASCMLLSCFFIILTVAVYAFLKKLRTLHGLVMITYLLNLFVGFLFMATMQILLLVNNISKECCVAMTFIIYFSILAAFFWLNVMCYDLWSKLRSSQNMAHGFASSTRLRFLAYSGYAFGLATALTILLASLEFSGLPASNKLLPRIRLQGCFLFGNGRLLYLYTPILGACLANLIFFILTARILIRMNKQTQAVRKSKDSKRFCLYIKLFIVTGINWVLEVISSLYPEGDNYWQFTDAYNVLVGFMIFLIFVCKKKTFISLRQRYRTLRGMPATQTDSTNTRTSSSTVSELPQNDLKMKPTVSTESKTDQKKTKGSSLRSIRKAFTAYVHTR